MIVYRCANAEDLEGIKELQQKYHVSTIKEEYKKDGFVTTLFTDEQFLALIEKENGLVIALDGDKIISYAMSASWEYWSEWPLFRHMIQDLPNTEYLGQRLSTENSYQYGPVCIDMEYRGRGVLENIFEYSRRLMVKRYPILITFINQINPRSLKAHTDKVGLDLIKTFDFNDNHYYELGYDMNKPVKGASLE
ncbi:GNAT family N-acetyltransferase [Microaceticoccus formicicus]|uniref:GNAT family N-acetyltransferase n=1 Tax=Microaceticoccus formicicus TaxID=3118105 RepID=UPI003CD03EB8|nr:GNAT family acetyltransferase [Peptoniphilaceae bacterium AMB_02]